MHEDEMKGKFDQVKGKIKETWGRLTDDEIALANGKMDQFLGKVQEKYGLAREDAEKRYKEILKACDCATDKSCCGSDKKSA